MERLIELALEAPNVGAALLAAVAAIIAYLAKDRLAVNNQVFRPRLAAYRSLWSLMAPASPRRKDPLTPAEREDLYKGLRSWYYTRGYGVFLSLGAQRAFQKVLDVLETAAGSPVAPLSELRTCLKKDLRVYDALEAGTKV